MSRVEKATEFSVLIYAKLSLTLTLVLYVGTLNSILLWLKCKRKTFRLSPVPFLCRHCSKEVSNRTLSGKGGSAPSFSVRVAAPECVDHRKSRLASHVASDAWPHCPLFLTNWYSSSTWRHRPASLLPTKAWGESKTPRRFLGGQSSFTELSMALR